MHLPHLIEDLSIILIVAAAMTLFCRAVGQPSVLGYLIAGFLVGPHFHWIPTVLDAENVKVWAEIGVIFLLFGLGLEFSFKKLVRVGAPASITAIIEVAGMVGIGFLLGRALGWNSFDSLFLGGILAISSTTIIIRALDELAMKKRGFVRLVFGVLIVEDLVAILLLVVLSTIAVSRRFSGTEMAVSALKLVFFLTLWFVLGIFLVPTFLRRIKRFLPAETLLVVALGLCFLMVVMATKAGFSPALGAFLMGSILAETDQAEAIEHLIQPIKDLFGAVFFVSIGMLIDPHTLRDQAPAVIAITLVTVVGKLLTTTAGALLAGQSLRHAVQAGLSLAQIGEFSFIIAGLGLNLQVTSDFIYPIAIAVSTITTFTTPYLIRSSDAVVRALDRHLSPQTVGALERFRVATETVAQTTAWRAFLRRVLIKTMANGVVIASIFLAIAKFLKPWLEAEMSSVSMAHALALGAAFLASGPFLWAILRGELDSEQALSWRRDRLSVGLMVAVDLARWLFAVLLCAVLASRIVSAGGVLLAVCVVVVGWIYFFARGFGRIYHRLEKRFLQNLHGKEEVSEKRRDLPALAPWDAHLAQLQVKVESPMTGRQLGELKIRERFGVTIALIERGRRTVLAPGALEAIYPGDVLHVIGTDDEIVRFAVECEGSAMAVEEKLSAANYVLKPIYIEETSPFAHKTIRDSGLREQTHSLVVGVEKKGVRTLNPDSGLLIEPNDVLWLVGDPVALARL